jgi:hypothetical protein
MRVRSENGELRGRSGARLLAFVAAAGVVTVVASCNLALGLNKFIDCPEDPSCPPAATCADGTKDGDETGVDCGGSCAACPAKQGCIKNGDCADGVCADGECAAPTCKDGVRNEDETDIDCGGKTCPGCGPTQHCASNADCTSMECSGTTCVASACTDGVENGDESAIDCGGTACPACDVGKTCNGDADCASKTCTSGTCQATCTDLIQDGDETAVDCGGMACPGCATGMACKVGGDCESRVCETGKCADNYVWAKQFGDASTQIGTAVAADQLGNTFLLSDVSGTVDFGGGLKTAPPPVAIAAAKFDPTGNYLWGSVFSGGQKNHAAGAAFDSGGNVVFTGIAATGANFGGGALSGLGVDNAFLVKLDTGGNHVWSKLFSLSEGAAIAISSLDAIALAGKQISATNYGCGTVPTSGGIDAVVAQFSSFGTCAWSKAFGGGSGTSSIGVGIAVDASQNVIFGGNFQGTVDFGCGALTASGAASGSVFVTQLDSNGTCVWSRSFGDPMDDPGSDPEIAGVAVDAAGNVFVTGYFAGTLDFGAGAATSLGRYDVFAAKLSSAGASVWFKHFGAAPMGTAMGGYDQAYAIAASATGKVVITGTAASGTDFGGGPLADTNGFVAELDPSGNYLWSRGFGTLQEAFGASVGYSGANDIVLTGHFGGSLDFGGGAMSSKGSDDIFLAKLLVP